jgi:hypothetical protein
MKYAFFKTLLMLWLMKVIFGVDDLECCKREKDGGEENDFF